ncbi:ABC transporter ATP-binding protein [Saccharospirillum sp. MSK14-1]|uniref:ABC transporter ATP-binding protein n=1 Tax=Saccharospirillum sp. MSK14-1 TaxID=1897632 RepID=UPI000D3A5DBF|nr:ATP-binding cassette domain-containing protein [Saccharospirillum sp. MSK14-1]PTY38601.1 ABC transporter ATP-binding protein [Saccharospirillum sp. MSK14-1]
MSALIEIEQLTIKTADGRPLVTDVSFSIHAGEPFCLVGETGSGKSLVMHALMGSLPDELRCSGQIRYQKENLLALPAAQRRAFWGRRFALLPQEPWLALDPTMTVLDQVAEVLLALEGMPLGQARKLATTELSVLGLGDNLLSYPFELSGGMAQRVSIAMARIAASPLLLADEPTKGLDKALCQTVADLLLTEADAGRGLLVITHDLDLVAALGGRLGVMRDGRLLESGVTEPWLKAPTQPYSRELIAAMPQHWPRPQTKVSAQRSEVVQAQGLSKSFGDRHLFSDLDVTLREGEVTVVLGPSGSGKSTLGNVLTGLLPADAGQLIWPESASPLKYQKIYQDPPAAFIAHQTLRQSFDDLLALHGLEPARLNHLLSELGLAEALLERRPSGISGGELQRLAIARALLLEPVMLFADEATSRLDPVSQKKVIELLLAEVAERGLALLLVTHDPALAERIADQLIRLDQQPTDAAAQQQAA